MKQYFVPAMAGLNTDIPARRLPDSRLSAASNITFEDAVIKKRWGLSQMPNGSFTNQVMGIHLFETATAGIKELLAFTTENAYVYDDDTGEFKLINRTFVKGTASASGTTVTGVSTEWQASWNNDYVTMKIGFGNTDANSITTWYTVSSIDSTTQITLTASAGTVGSGNYCLMFCFSGDEDNFFSVANPYDGDEADKVVAVCNGIEPIMIYVGSQAPMKEIGEQNASPTSGSTTLDVTSSAGLFVGMPVFGPGIAADAVIASITDSDTVVLDTNSTATLSDYPVVFGYRRPAKYLGYFGSVGFEHFLSANIKDTTNEPQRIEVGAAGKYPQSFLNDVTGDYGTYYQLFDSNEQIIGLKQLQDRIVVYKENSLTEMWAVPNGTNADPYNFRQDKIRDIAPISGETVVNYGSFHIFMGKDNFYLYDGVVARPIGDEIINSVIAEMNESYINRAFAMPIREERLYVIFLPTDSNEVPSKCYAYHYEDKTWTAWNFYDSSGNDLYVTSWGKWKKSYSPTWAEINTTGTLWSAADMRWTDLIIYTNVDRYLLGTSAGDIYEFADLFGTDDGYGFVSSFTTKDFDMGNPKYTVKVLEAILGMRRMSDSTGTYVATNMRIRASADFGNTWSEWMTVATSNVSEYIEGVANFNIRGKQVRFQIDNNVSSPPDNFEVETLNIGYNDSGLKR